MKSKFSIISLYKYNKSRCSLLYVLLFWCVVLEVVGVSGNIGLTDLLYFAFASVFFLKTLKIRQKLSLKYYIYPLVFMSIALYGYSRFGMTKMFLSQIRFFFNCTVFACIMSFFYNSEQWRREKLINSYLYVCLLCSTFLIIQFMSFYLLGFNLKFDIGDFNAASSEVYSSSALYRTGGFFNEPSWFALFMGPSFDIMFQKKKWKELTICLIALIFSTSNMGFLFIFIFLLSKLKGTKMKYIILSIILIMTIFMLFPFVFNRLFEALNMDSDVSDSNYSRVVEPLVESFFENALGLFGINTDLIYAINEDIFLNTFVFVLLSFGLVGLFFFLKMLFQKKHISITMILLFAVIIEGCYGRIDFWMSLLAASVFCCTPIHHVYIRKPAPIVVKQR